MIIEVLNTYGLKGKTDITPYGSGLINSTWKVETETAKYILQRINIAVFKTPKAIADNIEAIGSHLEQHHPSYMLPTPVKTLEGENMFCKNGEYYRLIPFVKNSHSVNVLESPAQAYEAANEFGKFVKLLSGFNALRLKDTIPGFHNLTKYYTQFEECLKNGNKERIKHCTELIQQVKNFSNILNTYEEIKKHKQFILRVTHHDTKISNVLLNEEDKGLCVIDLDTAMPGYFISDTGDMMRTFLSPVSEEESDFSKIEIREEYFEALAKGYLGQVKELLTDEEQNHFIYAGKFMIYMQALRFLTDYINNDIYYGAKYPTHNFVRAGNQLNLLQKFTNKEQKLTTILNSL